MTQNIETIRKMISAAKALNAPLFSLDLMERGIEGVKTARRQHTHDDGSVSYAMFGYAEAPDLDADEDTIMRGAEAAFAFACNMYLPSELASFRDRQDANELIILAQTAAKKYAG